jgi:hypothetical protein
MVTHSHHLPGLSLGRHALRRFGLALGGTLWATAGLVGIPAMLGAPASQSLAQTSQGNSSHPSQGRSTIIIRPPIIWPYPYPTYPTSNRQRVRVVFEALGSDWGAVYLDDRLIYRPHNHNREKSVYIQPGGYRLEVTGVVRSDVWASGYLDVGRSDANLLVIRFSKTGGVQVVGDPYVWVPDQ